MDRITLAQRSGPIGRQRRLGDRVSSANSSGRQTRRVGDGVNSALASPGRSRQVGDAVKPALIELSWISVTENIHEISETRRLRIGFSLTMSPRVAPSILFAARVQAQATAHEKSKGIQASESQWKSSERPVKSRYHRCCLSRLRRELTWRLTYRRRACDVVARPIFPEVVSRS